MLSKVREYMQASTFIEAPMLLQNIKQEHGSGNDFLLACLHGVCGPKPPGPKAYPASLLLLPQGMRGLSNPPASWPPNCYWGFRRE